MYLIKRISIDGERFRHYSGDNSEFEVVRRFRIRTGRWGAEQATVELPPTIRHVRHVIQTFAGASRWESCA